MTLQLEGFDAYATAQVPASEKWSAATEVTIVAGGGRSGAASDNCAHFDTRVGSVLSKTVSPTAVSGVYTATWGQAVRILSLIGNLTLGSIRTALSEFELFVNDQGKVWIQQTSGGVDLGTICASADHAVPIGTGGTYIEVQIRFEAGVSTACQLRVRDQWGTMNLVAQGALLALSPADQPYTTLVHGGGIVDGPGEWHVDDIYLNDGVPAATAIPYNGQLIYNDGYFSDTHIDAVYPTADGLNLATGNTPWVPNSGPTQYTQIDEHPPDEDTSYIEAGLTDQTSTFAFQSPRQGDGFGRVGCTGPNVPIYAIQWDGRLRTEAGERPIAPILRRIIGGTLATDLVVQAASIVIALTSYGYYPRVFDRNPTLSNAYWTFANFFRQALPVAGDMEFGVRHL